MGLLLLRDTYRDRVRGAWLGMSAGVTLGCGAHGSLTPVMKDFYDPVPGQPSASAEIDMQLLLIHALRTRGGGLSADELAEEWLDHVRYLPDAYGYADFNLRRGLRAPISGDFGNWFRNSATAAARAPLWAMVAPGDPQAAAALAWTDASIDHSGEGVWAAMFWAGAISAAFAAPDQPSVLAAALAMAPDCSRVCRAAQAAMSAFLDDVSFLAARDRIVEASAPSDFAEAPVNTGFAVYGWLRGRGDLGATITAASACGYAASISAGLAGALCGAKAGAATLPSRWLDPIGTGIVPGWGLIDLDVEHTVDEVVDNIIALGNKIVPRCCQDVELVDELPVSPAPAPVTQAPTDTDTVTTDKAVACPEPAASDLTDQTSATAGDSPVPPVTEGAELPAIPPVVPAQEPVGEQPEAVPVEPLATAPPLPPTNWRDNTRVAPLHKHSCSSTELEAGPFSLEVDYGADGPTIAPGSTSAILLAVRNTGVHPFTGTVTLAASSGWHVAVPGNQGRRQTIVPGGMARFGFVISVPENANLTTRNELTVVLTPEKGKPITCPVHFLGATCWWVVGPLPNVGEEGFHKVYEVEDRPELDRSYLGRTGGLVRWEKAAFAAPVIEMEERFTGMPGVIYLATALHVPVATEARIVVHTNDGARIWLNGTLVAQRHSHDPFRPVLGQSTCQADVTLAPGENRVMVKAVRDTAPYALCFCITDRQGHPLLATGSNRW